MKIVTVERERKSADDLPNDLLYTEDTQELESILSGFNYEWSEDITAAFVEVDNGEYTQVWVSEARKPHLRDALYTRIEAVHVPAEYHGQNGSNDYVILCWLWGVPAYNKNRSLHTDGTSLFSYRMKIGRRAMGRIELLDVHGFSKTTSRHASKAHYAVFQHYYRQYKAVRPENSIEELQEAAKKSFSVIQPAVQDSALGMPISHIWFFFPDEAPPLSDVSAIPGHTLIARKTYIYPETHQVVSRFERVQLVRWDITQHEGPWIRIEAKDGLSWWVRPSAFALTLR